MDSPLKEAPLALHAIAELPKRGLSVIDRHPFCTVFLPPHPLQWYQIRNEELGATSLLQASGLRLQASGFRLQAGQVRPGPLVGCCQIPARSGGGGRGGVEVVVGDGDGAGAGGSMKKGVWSAWCDRDISPSVQSRNLFQVDQGGENVQPRLRICKVGGWLIGLLQDSKDNGRIMEYGDLPLSPT
jgi:hypothetical protein